MACAHDWVVRKIPYCQCSGGPPSECCGTCPYCAKYRCDCSGFVSYCLKASRGYTTSTLPQVSHAISKNELKPGDMLLNVQDHVVFFGGWSNSARSNYWAIQEPGCHTSGPHYAFNSSVPYPFNWDPSLFKPYRYDYIVD